MVLECQFGVCGNDGEETGMKGGDGITVASEGYDQESLANGAVVPVGCMRG